MKNITLSYAAAALIVLCSAYTNWKEHVDKTHHYKISYPDQWSKQKVSSAIVFMTPKEDNEDMFQENVNLILQDLSKEPLTLEQYTNLCKKQVVDAFGPSAVISVKSATISGHKAKEFIYKAKYQDRLLKFKQYWFIKENVAYLFTYTAEPSKYTTYEDLATQTIQSFTFTTE